MIQFSNQQKKQIFNIIEAFGETKKKQLLNSLSDKDSSEKPKEYVKCSGYYTFCGFIGTVVVLIAIALILAVSKPFSINLLENSEIKSLLMFLAFVVALASYLAAAGRETVKSSSTCNDLNKLKKNIFFMATAEVSLIILAMLTIVRLFKDSSPTNIPYTEWSFCFDAFLVYFLAVILFGLAFLHCRIWYLEKPWNVSEIK